MSGWRLGLDLGSTAAKAVLLSSAGEVAARELDDSGRPPLEVADDLARRVLAAHGVTDASRVATGYGRNLAGDVGRTVTEITCHAKGINFLHPDARTVLDIGGQDAKAIRLGPDGGVEDFVMNDRCAAGTGRFLEVAARRYNLTVGDLSDFCGGDPTPAGDEVPFEISSTCVVFAESELVSLHARGVSTVEALRAVHRAIAKRVAMLLKQVGVAAPVYFTGGVARNATLARAVAGELGLEVTVADMPQFTGALGAALLAKPR